MLVYSTELNILDENFELIAIVDDYRSLSWTERYTDASSFELEVLYNEENEEIFQTDLYVTSPDSEKVMIIEKISLITDPDDGDRLLISGRSIEMLLDRRVLLEKKEFKENFQDAIEKLITENFISPSDPKRKIENIMMEKNLDPRINSLRLEGQYHGQTIYEIIKNVCEDRNIGISMTLSKNKKFIFELYIGEDRSGMQLKNVPVRFSRQDDNLYNFQYTASKYNYKNVVMIAGAGTGESQKITAVEAYEGGAIGITRREKFIDEASLKFDNKPDEDGTTQPQKLEQKGRESLVENKIDRVYEADVDITRGLVFRKDYNVGDLMSIENRYGLTRRVLLKEMTLSIDADGTFEAVPNFIDVKTVSEMLFEGKYTDGNSFQMAFGTVEDAKLWLDEKVDLNSSINRSRIFKMKVTAPINLLVNIEGLFANMTSLVEVDLTGFMTNKVKSMAKLFYNCYSLKKIVCGDILSVYNESTESMFDGCTALSELDLSKMNTSSVKNFNYMFRGCSSIVKAPTDEFTATNAETCSGMFMGMSSLFEIKLEKFIGSKFVDISNMFQGCSSLPLLDLSSMQLDNVSSASGVATGCDNIKKAWCRDNTAYDILNNAAYSTVLFNVKPSVVGFDFTEYEYVYDEENKEWKPSGKIIADDLGFKDISEAREWLNTHRDRIITMKVTTDTDDAVKDFSSLFAYCGELKTLDLTRLHCNKATSFAYFVKGCKKLEQIDFGKIKMSNVKYMNQMFKDCSSLKSINLDHNYLYNVTDMYGAFANCTSLTTLYINTINTARVRDISWAFNNCNSLYSLDISNWQLPNKIYTEKMFRGCSSKDKNIISGLQIIYVRSEHEQKLIESSRYFPKYTAVIIK